MKFDVIVGNPPYQEINELNGRSPAIYNHFLDVAYKLGDNVAMIHPARFLFDAGITPHDWNQRMLNNPHLKVIMYEQTSSQIFPNTDIKGGVCITQWMRNRNDWGLNGSFIHIDELRSIIEKIGIGGFHKIIYENTAPIRPLNARRPTDKKIRTNAFTELPEIFFKHLVPNTLNQSHTVKIIGLVNNKRTYRYVSRDLIDDPHLEKWKVFLPKANGSGAIGEVLSTPLVGEPLVGCTQTFIQIGSFDTRTEAENCMKYIKTKFCRALLGTLKITQDNPANIISLDEFKINWSKTISEIDQQLYKKYALSDEEINFIEERVKEMV